MKKSLAIFIVVNWLQRRLSVKRAADFDTGMETIGTPIRVVSVTTTGMGVASGKNIVTN